ncbi:mitochondrial tRNA methylthiotransferase CDK5RAP1 [Aplysia californica]|uniref:Mitochondrial tRNA methylthiotransferase CDK5RAP1 n=1 Tax=Aplysia californica TaxID=6500 RepID=A0ABM0JBR7_APLCA|nr:mitochondrial tRNA methylthiotransferase CDK5RAP1 [Aplysia californica]
MSNLHFLRTLQCVCKKSNWTKKRFLGLTPRLMYTHLSKNIQHSSEEHSKSAPEIKNDKGLQHQDQRHRSLASGPDLSSFLQEAVGSGLSPPTDNVGLDDSYLGAHLFHGDNRSVFIETYGCQMNVNDTEIAWSILQQNGFTKASSISEADVVLAITCAIREGAENKIWKRLNYFKSVKKRRSKHRPLKIGLLGCMAERLKHKILEQDKMVDVVCGPDAYRDLPRLLAVTRSTDQAAVNVQLSLEETYADVVPVRLNSNSPSAFVSIMRGCDNMCTYCIVPFTRGRERSRPISSILEEIHILSEQNVKDVTLLGQNVNSYRDVSSAYGEDEDMPTQLSAGFKTVYKPKTGGRRFAELLEAVSKVDPEMRIRFTSPHPKDFPDEVLHTIMERPNVCKQIHLPAQSGNSEVLKAMGRGYSREAYLELVERVRDIIPGVGLSSDFIAGFCGESEAAHQDTLSLLDIVKYNFAFCFPYSMRQKTRAYHRLQDDVPQEVKLRRNTELHDRYRKHAEVRHKSQIGQRHLVLVEGESKRSSLDLSGRNDANTKVVFPNQALADVTGADVARTSQPGDYVVVEITSGNSLGMKGTALYRTSLQHHHRQGQQETLHCSQTTV